MEKPMEKPMLLSRPREVYIDEGRCIRCGVCEQIVPGLLGVEGSGDKAAVAGSRAAGMIVGPLLVSDQILDAMAACPTAAIRWSEGES